MSLPAWIVTDLDKTLLHDDLTISSRSLHAIDRVRKAGVKFAIATTRNLGYARDYIEILKPDAMVLSGGALGYIGGKERYRMTLAAHQASLVIRQFETTFPVQRFVIDSPDGRFGASETPLPRPFTHDVLSMFIWLHQNQRIYDMNNLDGLVDLTALWQPDMYRVSHHKATKAEALRYLFAEYDPRQILCFGDDLMDVGMLGHFTGIAVANALEPAKQAAKAVTASNEEDGVARWIEQL